MERRQFLKTTTLGVPGFVLLRQSQTADPSSSLVVAVQGESPAAITEAAVGQLGGMGTFVSKGSVVMIKPNLAFAQSPKQAATTSPEVMKAVIQMVQAAGAKQVIVMDNPVDYYKGAYEKSGIQALVTEMGAEMRAPDLKRLVKYDFKGGMVKGWQIFKDFLEVDVLINVPILKTHSQTGMTIGMKNLMGTIEDRPAFHGRDIGKRIADLALGLPPHLNIIDAYRVIAAGGPVSGRIVEPKMVIVSTNILEGDVVGASLLSKRPNSVSYFEPAFKRGMGQIDMTKINLKSYMI